ncbi:MAG: TauD/TfdA family dioxygenase [Candidatus Nanopelagicales bacterium]
MSNDQALRLWVHAEQAAKSINYSMGASDLLIASSDLTEAIPKSLRRRLRRFQLHGTVDNVLLLRNLLADEAVIAPTPIDPDEATSLFTTCATRLILLSVASLLGAPYGSATSWSGRFTHDVLPVRGSEHSQTSLSSTTPLDFHVEHAYLGPDRCGYLALLCLRGDEATTKVAPARAMRLSPAARAVLVQERFLVFEDLPADLRDLKDPIPMAVLSGPDDDPRITLDPLYMDVRDPDDFDARAALNEAIEEVPQVARGCTLRRGDLLLIDNLRTLHGRTPFTPRYDGTDRWLHRVLVGVSRQQTWARDAQWPVIRPRPTH